MISAPPQSRRGALRRLVVLATINYWALLAVVTHLPPGDLPSVKVNDKLEHVAGFGMLAGMLVLSAWSMGFARRLTLVAVLLLCMAYGALDETTQPWTGRSCDLWDWMADSLGAAMGVGAFYLAQRYLPRRRVPDYQI